MIRSGVRLSPTAPYEVIMAYPNDPVFYVRESVGLVLGWYFYDESWAYNYGPYATEWQARAALWRYCDEVLGFDFVRG